MRGISRGQALQLCVCVRHDGDYVGDENNEAKQATALAFYFSADGSRPRFVIFRQGSRWHNVEDKLLGFI